MNRVSEDLKTLLTDMGAGLVGFADLQGLDARGFPFGISVALPVPKTIVRTLEDGPDRAYYEMYHEWNRRLNQMVSAAAELLTNRGFSALAQTTDTVKQNADWCSELPHKTVATRAGLGWIGKNCLLVTPEFGSAIRLSSCLTDAPLDCGVPVEESKCGNCECCVKSCPAGALNGVIWHAGMERELLFQKALCKEKQREIMQRNTGIDTDLCGKCFAVCPYTRRYLKDGRAAPPDSSGSHGIN